ncbi:MAG: sulfotransferase family protein [Solirubrobacteraceae bacterium]
MTTSSDGLAAARASGRPLPEFFIVGHPKSGTTALYEMLRSHPLVFMPKLKEPRFLARELHPNIGPDDPHPNTLEDYLALFAPAAAAQRIGEASPSYLRSELAAARIAELQPQARIIAILREPASFMRSLHLELLKDHVETEKDFRAAMAREEAIRDQKPLLWYSDERVEYVTQLRRYHEIFPPERVLVLIYDDFRTDNEGTVRRVLRFLDVDDTAPIEGSEANRTVLVRSPRMYEAVRSVYLGRGPAAKAVKTGIKAFTPQRVRHEGLKTVRDRVLWSKPPPPDEELMLELRKRYAGEVQALSEYLGRDLVTLWGYDRLD